MAKLILSMDSLVLKEIPLDKERITIGRKPSNDIQIDNLTISGEHALVTTVLGDSFVEDVDSTNGTLVNGKNIRRHALKHNDLIEMGKYAFKFITEDEGDAIPVDSDDQVVEVWSNQENPSDFGLDSSTVGGAAKGQGVSTPAQNDSLGTQLAAIRILEGPSAGKGMDLTKARTTLGRANLQIVAIVRHPDGYYLLHVSGKTPPKVNDTPLNENQLLHDKDILEIAGARMEFYYKY